MLMKLNKIFSFLSQQKTYLFIALFGLCTSFSFFNYLPRLWEKYLSPMPIFAWLLPAYQIWERTRWVQLFLFVLLAGVVAYVSYVFLLPHLLQQLKQMNRKELLFILALSAGIVWLVVSNMAIPMPLDKSATQKLEIIPVLVNEEQRQLAIMEIKIDSRKIPFKALDIGEGWRIEGKKLIYAGSGKGSVLYSFPNKANSTIEIIFQEGKEMGKTIIV